MQLHNKENETLPCSTTIISLRMQILSSVVLIYKTSSGLHYSYEVRPGFKGLSKIILCLHSIILLLCCKCLCKLMLVSVLRIWYSVGEMSWRLSWVKIAKRPTKLWPKTRTSGLATAIKLCYRIIKSNNNSNHGVLTRKRK